MQCRWAAIALLAYGLLVAERAEATPNFPPGIQRILSLPYQPPCSICHRNGVTGLGTVTTPFGTAMRQRGLVAGDLNSLDVALQRMRADRVDSNGDGITDIDSLLQGIDPNTGANIASAPPRYGCGATLAHGPPGRWGLVTLALGGLVACARRRARRYRSVA